MTSFTAPAGNRRRRDETANRGKQKQQRRRRRGSCNTKTVPRRPPQPCDRRAKVCRSQSIPSPPPPYPRRQTFSHLSSHISFPRHTNSPPPTRLRATANPAAAAPEQVFHKSAPADKGHPHQKRRPADAGPQAPPARRDTSRPRNDRKPAAYPCVAKTNLEQKIIPPPLV